MPPHSLCTTSSEPRQTAYLVPTTPPSPALSLHQPSLAHSMKSRNAKQLSLNISPLSSDNISCSTSGSIDPDSNTSSVKNTSLSRGILVTSSPSLLPPSKSLASRRTFTPAPLSSASLQTPLSVSASSKRRSQLLLDDALPTPRLPLPTTATSHRSISAYFSDYSMESGAASPYTSEPVCVLPNLYLGAEHNATDLRTLQRLGITFVLNVAIEIAQEDSSLAAIASSKTDDAVTVRGGVHYKSLAWTHHQKNLLRDFPVAFALIDEALAHNSGSGKALVHCQLGVSRSASLVIAYVMRSLNMGLTEAYDFVKQRSGVISPNMSLMYQLAEYEKSLKNPTSAAAALATTDSCSTYSSSEQKRSSWSSQIDDDEPPYPFSAAFSAAAATSDSTASVAPVSRRATISFLLEDASMASVPSTPIRQEFHKRPLTPENGFEDHPNTKPFQSPSRLTLPKSSFLASRRNSRSGGYQRSPLTPFSAKSLDSQSRTPTQASYPPKTPTTERFSSLTLEVPSSFDDVEMMVPPTPLFQSSFTIPSLSSSSSSSSASSVSSFEACSRPSVSSSESMASLAYSAACDNEQVYSSSAPVELCSPRNSGAWSLLPSTRMASSAEVTVVVNHEKSLQSIASSSSSLPSSPSEPKLKQSESKKKHANALWSGLNALKVVAGVSAVTSSTGRAIVVATAATAVMATTTSASSEAIAVSTTTEATTDFTTATSSATVVGGAGAAKINSGANKLPDFIFSPRPYTPTHHETRSFGDFYQALCMES